MFSVPLQAQDKPLPDRTQFLIEFQVKRQGLHKLFGPSDQYSLLSQYTYRENVTEMSLDGKGNTKSTKKQVIEYIPTRVFWNTYERQIVKDDKPLTAEELEKQDRKNEEKVAKLEANQKKQGAENARKHAERRRQLQITLAKDFDKRGLTGDARKAEEEKALKIFDDAARGIVPNRPPPKMEDSSVLRAADFQLVGRETINGRPAIVLTFKPKPDYKGGGDGLEKYLLQNSKGKVWVDENDYQMAKIEIEVTDSISLALGLLAKVQPGSRAFFEWRKFNEEVWLPYRSDFTAKIRILLVKGEHIREIHEYSDYKKFVVSTSIKPVEQN
jgi:hypothetical protein